MNNLTFLPAYQLAQMISSKHISYVELLEAYLTQIEKCNSQLNAICTLDADNGRKKALSLTTS